MVRDEVEGERGARRKETIRENTTKRVVGLGLNVQPQAASSRPSSSSKGKKCIRSDDLE